MNITECNSICLNTAMTSLSLPSDSINQSNRAQRWTHYIKILSPYISSILSHFYICQNYTCTLFYINLFFLYVGKYISNSRGFSVVFWLIWCHLFQKQIKQCCPINLYVVTLLTRLNISRMNIFHYGLFSALKTYIAFIFK